MSKQSQKYTEDEALEIIELSSESFETLARAFELIAEVCADEAANVTGKEAETSSSIVVH